MIFPNIWSNEKILKLQKNFVLWNFLNINLISIELNLNNYTFKIENMSSSKIQYACLLIVMLIAIGSS